MQKAVESKDVQSEVRRVVLNDSTKAFVVEAQRTPGYSLLDLLHGYVYARWPYLYIGIGVGEHPFSDVIKTIASIVDLLPFNGREKAEDETFAEGYHGKVMPTESAKQLVAVREPISVEDLESVIPYTHARAIILKNPDHIVALECPCRASRSDPCQPIDVCLIVGEPFASFVREHHPHRSRWIESWEAQHILQAEHERGHVHHAFFKDAMFGRFYAICNCCPCCCGAMQSMRNGTPMLTSSGYVSSLAKELCQGCGHCTEACPFGALSLNGTVAKVDKSICMGCGVCVSACDMGALSLMLEPTRGIPLEICDLIERVEAQ
ncbi:MAG: 4Fe-4S ferredoxin [Anaerolineales bacterium]|nr:4Fe-4S ferredoxin [Anaerolineales bacterium]